MHVQRTSKSTSFLLLHFVQYFRIFGHFKSLPALIYSLFVTSSVNWLMVRFIRILVYHQFWHGLQNCLNIRAEKQTLLAFCYESQAWNFWSEKWWWNHGNFWSKFAAFFVRIERNSVEVDRNVILNQFRVNSSDFKQFQPLNRYKLQW